MTQTLTKSLAAVGEEISHELGAKMVKDYQNAFPSDVASYQIGRNILESLLAQPDCVGIRFYNAINEVGEKTLVYVGINENNQVIAEYVTVNDAGELAKQKAIVADRVRTQPLLDDADLITWGLPE
jgi:hypothetical protein